MGIRQHGLCHDVVHTILSTIMSLTYTHTHLPVEQPLVSLLEAGEVQMLLHVVGLGPDVQHDAFELYLLGEYRGREQPPQVQPECAIRVRAYQEGAYQGAGTVLHKEGCMSLSL